MNKVIFVFCCILFLSCKKDEQKTTTSFILNEIGIINSQDPLYKATAPILVNRCVDKNSLSNSPISYFSIVADSFDLKQEQNCLQNADFSRLPILNDYLFGKNVVFAITEKGILADGSVGIKKQFHELYSPKPIQLIKPEIKTDDDLYPKFLYGEIMDLKWVPDNNNINGLHITLSWMNSDLVNTHNFVVPDIGEVSIDKIFLENIPNGTPAYIDIRRRSEKIINLESDNYFLVSECVFSFTFFMSNK